MSWIKEYRCEKKSLLRVDFALKSPALAIAVSLSKSLSLANENSHDKSPSLASVDFTSKSPSLAEGDLGGGLLENDKNSQNPLNSKENSQISQDKSVENSNNATNTHPQTPSAREGAYLSDFAQQGALNGANYTLQGKGASRAVPQAREGNLWCRHLQKIIHKTSTQRIKNA